MKVKKLREEVDVDVPEEDANVLENKNVQKHVVDPEKDADVLEKDN